MAFTPKPSPPDINLVAGQDYYKEIIADFAHEWSWPFQPHKWEIRGYTDIRIRAIGAKFLKADPNIHTFGDAWNGIQFVHYHADAKYTDFDIRRVYIVGRPLREGSAKVKIFSRYSYQDFVRSIVAWTGHAEISINVAPSDYSPGDGSEYLNHDHNPNHEPLLQVSPAVRDAAVKKRRWVKGYAFEPGSPEQVETLTYIAQQMQNETEETPTLIRQATVRNSPEWLGTNQRHLDNTDGIVHVDWTDLQHYDLLVAHPSGGSGFLEMDQYPAEDHTWEVTSSDHQAGKKIRIATKVIPAAGEHTVTLTARNACGPSERTFRIVVPSS